MLQTPIPQERRLVHHLLQVPSPAGLSDFAKKRLGDIF